MLTFPNAKINLGLNIVSKRADGYHNLETVFYPIALHDRLEIKPAFSSNVTLNMSGIPIDDDADNIVLKAYSLLYSHKAMPAVEINLEKGIPMGAGLGGGSADAVAALQMMNSLFDMQLTKDELKQYARRLGADCPFFLHNRPMLGCGIGDELMPVDVDITGYHLLLVKPDIHISTAEAYAGCSPRKWDKPLADIIKQPVDTWRYQLVNDFEPSVFAAHPELGEIKELLYQSGAGYASMSGSGSTVYALFNRLPEQNALRAELRRILNQYDFNIYYQ